MALIQWNEALSVQVAEIDGQHKRLIAMIGELDGAMREGKGRDVMGKIVNGLIGYTGTHFATEEKYFDQFGYPEADSHKAEHRNFVQKVSEFKAGFEAGRLGLSIQVMDFLSDWLKGHISGTDKKYAPFFKEKGLK
jgi:hemerythrin